ncbi:MAG: gamma-glutamyltransferase [Actinomycetota bacterium]|nr:gamma-glutamyltransferase [Actinomycetota bacterium]
MRRILLAMLLIGALCSCGVRSSAQNDDAPREDRTAAEAEETTASRRSADEESPEPAAPARVEELAEGPASRNTTTRPAIGANGMVSSAHPLATKAGLEILEDGGNAFDAAVAVAAALGVVEPEMSGIGGYGAIVVYDAEKGETRFLEIGSKVPESMDHSIFRPPTPNYLENRCGAPVVATPGNLNAWETLSKEYGDLEWGRLLDPAIGHAENGFVIGEELAGWLGSEYSAFPEHAQEIYGRGGAPLGAGDRLVQKDLAASLHTIAEQGAGAVYGGELGEAMVSEVQQNGGFLTMGDLRNNRVRWHETVGMDYRGNRVVTAGPPATAWGALVRLGILGQFDLEPPDHNSVSYLHALTEVSKRLSATAGKFIEPETREVRLRPLLSEEYLTSEAAKIDFSRAAPYDPPMKTDTALNCSPTNYTPTTAPDTRQHTTHFVVADREGNVVSSTETLGNVFGSKVMPEGTGIWLNDEVAWARFDPAGNPFDAAPGRQIPYALGPTLVMRDGQPWMALGTPGGRTILQTTPQMLTNVIDFDMDVQRAVASPRFSFIIPNLLAVEEGIPIPVREELEAMGHPVYVEPELGSAHALTIKYGPGGEPVRFTGGADPRGEGAAIGY